MGRSRYKIYDDRYPYFMTNSFVKGLPLFAKQEIAEIVLDSLIFLQKNRLFTLYIYVLMENHMHLIAQSDQLSEKMKQLKSFTAKEVINYLSKNSKNLILKQPTNAKLKHKNESSFQVWQEGFHPKHIFGNKMMFQKMNYIHQNPVKRGYVFRAEDWRYSSARDYNCMEGLNL